MKGLKRHHIATCPCIYWTLTTFWWILISSYHLLMSTVFTVSIHPRNKSSSLLLSWTQYTSFWNLVLHNLAKWFGLLHFPHLRPCAGHWPLFSCSDPHLVHSADLAFCSLLKRLLWSPCFSCLGFTLRSSPAMVCSWALDISWVLTIWNTGWADKRQWTAVCKLRI